MRRLLVFSLTTLLSGCGLFRALQPPAPPVAEPEFDGVTHVLSNTVALVSHSPDGDEFVYCSGAAVEGTFVTADHCVAPVSAPEYADWSFTVTFRGESYPLVVVTRWPEKDLAVIDASGARTVGTLEMSDWEPDYGVKVAWAGHPGQDPHTHIFHGFISSPIDSELSYLFDVDGQFIPGNSGGPVVDERARLLGIVASTATAVFVLPQLIDIGQAVRPEYIRELLDTR